MKLVKPPTRTAVRIVDLSEPLHPLTELVNYEYVRVFVTLHNRLLGAFSIANLNQPISITRLCNAIVANLAFKLIEPNPNIMKEEVWAKTISCLTRHFMPRPIELSKLPPDVAVSVILATRDRPDDLRECLHCLVTQTTSRPVEIIVVDNNPDSGVTVPVVAEFPGVLLVNERRKGLSYARNKGFGVSSGEILITVDDDVTMPSDWLEKLLIPFSRSDVMAVTGNVLPLELETKTQHLFEEYGGLGRGFEKFEVGGDWFEAFRYRAVPTWSLGATANAAFRASILSHPQIGMLDEALGVGMPSGCSEDTYLFYKILKAGCTILYQPEAYVWHKHRRDIKALLKMIYNYSKGHVAYHLTTLLRDGDFRALFRIFFELPKAHVWRALQRLRGKSSYPLFLILLEILGNLVGPWALWKSRRRIKHEGHSQPYIPASRRNTTFS
jgi:glycosyltransferase involved in cell wall biosynthesis